MPTDFDVDYTGKFIHISEELLRCRKLSLVQMALLSTIKSLTKQDAVCYASNAYLSQFLHVSENTVDNNLKRLEDNGYIKRINPKSRNRRIVVLESSLDRFVREEFGHKKCGDTENVTKTGLIENDMTTKIVIDDHNNCDDTSQKLGTIIISDIDNDIIPNQREFMIGNNINYIVEPDFQNSPEWRQFKQNAIQMQAPVGLMNLIRSKVGASGMKLSRSEFTSAIKSGADPAMVYYAALQTYDKSGSLVPTLETLGNDIGIPEEIQTEADRVISQILTDAETNFKKQKG